MPEEEDTEMQLLVATFEQLRWNGMWVLPAVGNSQLSSLETCCTRNRVEVACWSPTCLRKNHLQQAKGDTAKCSQLKNLDGIPEMLFKNATV